LTLLIAPEALADRRRAAAGHLRSLADSLAADLIPVIERDLFIPPEKARLSRDGGRCPRHGVPLEFDPFSPRRHRCPQCGEVFDGEDHYRWWIMSYQLWLAERAVHGALLGVLRNDAPARALAERIVGEYTERYSSYPNADNVLGPTRLFFSTYLESIWLLQLCVAIDLLESGGSRGALGERLRDRVIQPSAGIIRSYDEGSSNRQSWNNAALLAAALVLDRPGDAEGVVWGDSGLAAQLGSALLADGTWYEGENYHLFAHRALWYSVQMAEVAGLDVGTPLTARFEAGFGAPFLGVLPDLTLPSRRDSQYAISVRQWRFAELCELGLARRDDPALASILGRLYAGDIPRRETGRASSAAEVERNVPPSALTRSDLGWRSLLLAREVLPSLAPEPPRSALLEGQGYAVLRRGDERDVYIALDYGHSGGGHGHPDRLNLQLAHGEVRWLDDMGTGSYVDPSLHWYRSTLAHNAPLVDGRSQARVHGSLRAFEDRGREGWVDAEVAGIAPGVRVSRAIVAMESYIVDAVEWEAERQISFELPFHLDADVHLDAPWTAHPAGGAGGLEDGFDFVRQVERSEGSHDGIVRWATAREGRTIAAWSAVAGEHEWLRGIAPGPPGRAAKWFYWSRARGTRGAVRAVIDWKESVRSVRLENDAVVVDLVHGVTETHSRDGAEWRIERRDGGAPSTVRLGGLRSSRRGGAPAAGRAPARGSGLVDALARAMTAIAKTADPLHAPAPAAHVVPRARDEGAPTDGLSFALGAPHYRRSEESWEEAGAPEAVARLAASDDRLLVDVEVAKPGDPVFAPPRARNELDNEHPDINSDGVQLYLASRGDAVGAGWLLVPEAPGDGVRVTSIAGTHGEQPIDARWTPTHAGYRITVRLPLAPEMRRDGFDFDLIVNEMPAGRERRRGQLVLSGGEGDWIYLRGDRQPRARYMHFVIARD
jgi:hypothetical protein